jgi:hypothetical protein
MPTKPVTVLSLGAMILIMTALAQTTLAVAQAIELAQAHSTESREACDHAGGRCEDDPWVFHSPQGRWWDVRSWPILLQKSKVAAKNFLRKHETESDHRFV